MAGMRRVIAAGLWLGLGMAMEAADPGLPYLEDRYRQQALPDHMETPYPVIPVLFENGRYLPVLGVDYNRPWVPRGGKKSYVTSGQQILFMPLSHFTTAGVEMRILPPDPTADPTAEGFVVPQTQWVPVRTSEAGERRSVVIRLGLRADQTVRHLFAAAVFFDDAMNRRIFWRSIGTLPKEQERIADIVTDPLPHDGQWPHNFILLFTPRGEVMTTRRLEVGKALAAMDLKWMEGNLNFYRKGNPGADIPAFPMYHGAMMVPDSLGGKIPEGMVRLRLGVDAFGFVHSPRVMNPEADPVLQAVARRNVVTWKFYPKMVEGETVDTEVIVPFVFRMEAEKEG